MRKSLIAIGLLLALGTTARAEVESLLGAGYWEAWVKPEMKVTPLADDTAGIAGIQLGTSIGHGLYIGAGYYSLVNSVKFGSPEQGEIKATDLWYAGGDLDYTFLASKLVHGSADLFVGGGRATADMVSGGSDRANLFVVEPGLTVMINVTPDVEIGLGAGYRIVSGSGIDGLSNSDLSGFTGSIFFRWTETR